MMYRGIYKLLSLDESKQLTTATCLTLMGAVFGFAGAWIAITDVVDED